MGHWALGCDRILATQDLLRASTTQHPLTNEKSPTRRQGISFFNYLEDEIFS